MAFNGTPTLLGGDRRYHYPKYVWTPAGGWWTTPANAKRNTRFAMVGIALAALPIFYYSTQIEVRSTRPRVLGLLASRRVQWRALVRLAAALRGRRPPRGARGHASRRPSSSGPAAAQTGLTWPLCARANLAVHPLCTMPRLVGGAHQPRPVGRLAGPARARPRSAGQQSIRPRTVGHLALPAPALAGRRVPRGAVSAQRSVCMVVPVVPPSQPVRALTRFALDLLLPCASRRRPRRGGRSRRVRASSASSLPSTPPRTTRRCDEGPMDVCVWGACALQSSSRNGAAGCFGSTGHWHCTGNLSRLCAQTVVAVEAGDTRNLF